MKKRMLGVLLLCVLLTGLLSVTALGATVESVQGTIKASDCYYLGKDWVLTGDTTLIMDADLNLRSIRGNYDLTIQDQGGHTLTITMPMSDQVITANGSGHGISVKSLTCDADLDIKVRKDGLNIDGDINYTAKTLGITCGGDAVYSRNGDVYLIDVTSVMITAEGSCIFSPKGYVQFRGDYLNAETTDKSHSCILGERVNLEGGEIIASSKANCIVANDFQGIQLAGKITATGGYDYGSVINARNGSGITIADGSELTVRGEGYGLYATKGVEMEGSGKLDIEAGAGAGIYAGNGDIRLQGEARIVSGAQTMVAKSSVANKGVVHIVNTKLSVRNTDPYYSAIQGKRVSIKVNEGTVISSCQYAVRAAGNITLDGYLKITTESTKTPSAVLKTTDGGNVSLEGVSSVTLVGKDKAIDCDGTFYQDDAPLIAEAGVVAKKGVHAEGKIYITASEGNGIRVDNGDIKLGEYAEITAKDSAIVAENGNVSFTSLKAASSERLGIYALGNVTMLGEANSSGTLEIESLREGIRAEGGVTLEGKTIRIDAKRASGIITPGDVTVKAKETYIDGALEPESYIMFFNSSDTENQQAISANRVTLEGGVFYLYGYCNGIFARGDITLTGYVYIGSIVEYNALFGASYWQIPLQAIRTSGHGNIYINGPKVEAYTKNECAAISATGNKIFIDESLMILEPSRGRVYVDVIVNAVGKSVNRNVIGENLFSGAAAVWLDRTIAAVGTIVSVQSKDTPDGLIFQWQFSHDKEEIVRTENGATSYRVRDGDVGMYVRAVVTADGYTSVLYSDWCSIPTSTSLTGSLVFTSGAKVGGWLTTARVGLLKTMEDTAPDSVHFQWQHSLNGESFWEDIDGATSPYYNITAADVGTFLRLTATVDGMTGKVVSPTKEIAKAPAPDTVAMSSLSYADGVVTVTRAFGNQEYVLTLSSAVPSASQWLQAVSVAETGPLDFDVSDKLDQTVYVHTRVKETATTLVGTKVKYSSIYTGQRGTLAGLTLKNASGSPVSNETGKAGRIVAVTVAPLPADYPSGQWAADTVNWYVNNNPLYPGAVELYADANCTTPLERDEYGVIKPTTRHTVYYKATSWTNNVMIGASKTIGYNQIVDSHMYLNVSNENDEYILQSMYFESIEAFPGDEITTGFTTRPEKSYLGELTFQARNTNPASALTVIADTATQKVTVTVPEDAVPGIYSYDYLIDGVKPTNGTYIVINVKEKTATVSFDDGGAELLSDEARLQAESMESQTVDLGAQFILPENGFYVPEGWEFDGWDAGEVGDGIDVTEDVTVTAQWKQHIHEMVHEPGYENGCEYPGQMEHWYCEKCGKAYGDENGYYPFDPVFMMLPAHGHETEGAEAKKENEAEPTCTEDGGYDMVLRCTVCSEAVSIEHTAIPALGHIPGEAVRENEMPAICTADGSYDEVVYCTVCESELSREAKAIPALGHTLTPVAAAEPTCTEAGNEAYYVCETCGEWYFDAAGTEEITDHHDVEIKALEHSWGEVTYTWAEDYASVTASAVCAHDGEHVLTETAESTYEVITPATTEADGVGTYTATFKNTLFTAQAKTVAIPRIPTYSVTVVSGEGGTASASPASGSAGTVITLTAVPESGYTFKEWQVISGGVTVTEDQFTLGSTDVVIQAIFEAETAVSGAVSGNTLTYSVTSAPAGAKLIAARYDGGRMTDVQIIGDVGESGTLTMKGSGGHYQLFLVDSDYKPICPAWNN